IQSDAHNAVPNIRNAPWPGFPADLMSIMLVTATQAEGTIIIHDWMFESRLFFVDRLIAMGARIILCDPHRAVVIGPSALHGEHVHSPDIRAGMAMLIAALAARGTSVINNAGVIDRGYEKIVRRLTALGAHIERLSDGAAA
ncbi:MAG: UDP-N-acetylglucosamine 1-carboxyvinyltransferase, partial [Chloroflexi bacterium]|nr:UDP-N-acetylglucosamine 1-carboxyvinyltransferase [Chloroflexota bacterium]